MQAGALASKGIVCKLATVHISLLDYCPWVVPRDDRVLPFAGHRLQVSSSIDALHSSRLLYSLERSSHHQFVELPTFAMSRTQCRQQWHALRTHHTHALVAAHQHGNINTRQHKQAQTANMVLEAAHAAREVALKPRRLPARWVQHADRRHATRQDTNSGDAACGASATIAGSHCSTTGCAVANWRPRLTRRARRRGAT